jgi:hypothetical protein
VRGALDGEAVKLGRAGCLPPPSKYPVTSRMNSVCPDGTPHRTSICPPSPSGITALFPRVWLALKLIVLVVGVGSPVG